MVPKRPSSVRAVSTLMRPASRSVRRARAQVVFAESKVGGERARGSRHGSTGCGRRSVEVDEDHPRGLPDGSDDLRGLGTDDDGVAIGPRLRASHAASFGFARSALVHRSSAARGTTIRRLPSRTHGSPARVVRNWRARLYASVLLMPRTAAASSTVRNGRSLVDDRAGRDRDTKTSTGECGCVVPSSVALSATYSFGVVFGDATKNSETVRFAVLLHTSPFAPKLARPQQNLQGDRRQPDLGCLAR